LILARRQIEDAQRATPTRRTIVGWEARGQAGPPPPVIVEVAASVTSCRQDAGATVLDEHRQPCARGSAASLGGDVGGTNQITVPMKLAEGAAESAAVWLGDLLAAGGWRRQVVSRAARARVLAGPPWRGGPAGG